MKKFIVSGMILVGCVFGEEKAKAAGCDDYLSKPIDEDLLFAKLQDFLGHDGQA